VLYVIEKEGGAAILVRIGKGTCDGEILLRTWVPRRRVKTLCFHRKKEIAEALLTTQKGGKRPNNQRRNSPHKRGGKEERLKLELISHKRRVDRYSPWECRRTGPKKLGKESVRIPKGGALRV